ncbi:MAG: hypothetical protein MR210_04160 [Erysipelotrichaceae bacterium]|nr:hypothetical protein [Erysipelotrichaceae bacterium]
MIINDLKTLNTFEFINEGKPAQVINGVFIGDLLSWVMANGQPDQLWITVQAHLNVVAVSLLKEFAGIILCDGATCDETFISKCQEEKVNLIQSPLSAYECAKLLAQLGL